MFNLEFGGSNSAQELIGTMTIAGKEQSLYIAPQDLEQACDFFRFLRNDKTALDELIDIIENLM